MSENMENSCPEDKHSVGPEEKTCDSNIAKETVPDTTRKTERENTESDIEGDAISQENSGNESDGEEEIDDENDGEDNYNLTQVCYPSQQPGFTRDLDIDLPKNVTLLTTEDGCKVYLVGTAHFSKESQSEVVKTIELTQPDRVLLELCPNRISILNLDEETLMKEAKNINFSKIQMAIKQNGLVQGIMHLLLLSMSAHLTKQLGMAPGGEFRVALHAARRICGCQVVLGDRAIQVTLRRALASLSWWQSIRLAWYIITSKEPISKEDVEKYKEKDFLEEMLREMTGEFPALSRVFVKERDLYLAKSLYNTAQVLPPLFVDEEEEAQGIPSVVVGVVGIGHTPGIIDNWNSVRDADLRDLMEIPKPSMLGTTMKWTIRAALIALLSWSCYKGCRWTASFF